MAKSDLAARLAVAVVGVPVIVTIVYVGGWLLGGVIAAVAAIAAHEFNAIAAATGGRPFNRLGVASAALMVLAATWGRTFEAFSAPALALVLLLTVVCISLAIWRRWPDGSPVSAVSATVAGVIYTGGTLAFLVLIRHLPTADGAVPTAVVGTALATLPMGATWIGDSCAYFAGRAWGRTKLIPQVSPGKTVVGGVAGLAGTVVAASLWVAVFVGPGTWPGLGLASAAVIGLFMGAAAQVGDLAASVLKREAGVKDSGRLLPGHGGAIDRFDALFFTVPLFYVLVRLVELLA